jgi:transposase-like protein/IS1 family transposase
MTCQRCQHASVRRFGFYGRRRIQRFRCNRCGATFAAAHDKPLGSHYLDIERAVQIASMLVEGVSIRAIARLTGTDKNTIMSLLLTVGAKCRSLFDARICGIKPRYVQLDELWNFCFKKQNCVRPNDPPEWGDTYTWIALDADTKLAISYLVGKRDTGSAHRFIADFSNRVRGRMQVTSDGFQPYVSAMAANFGDDVDFAQLVKIMGKPDNAGPDWYGPAQVLQIIQKPITGRPDRAHICTSHVERANLSVRMHLRRFTRLTNAFSKKLTHLKAAVDLYMTWYNFCRVHQTLRITPAMEAGVTDHIWNVQELLTWSNTNPN